MNYESNQNFSMQQESSSGTYLEDVARSLADNTCIMQEGHLKFQEETHAGIQ